MTMEAKATDTSAAAARSVSADVGRSAGPATVSFSLTVTAPGWR